MPDAQNSERFLGKQLYSLDEKGRLTIPKHWRLKNDQDEQWRLLPDSLGKCLHLMEPWRFTRFLTELDQSLAGDRAKFRLLKGHLTDSVIEALPDKQGRIAIPKDLCDALGLRDEVWMRGTGDVIEIWNKAKFEEHKQSTRSATQEISSLLGI